MSIPLYLVIPDDMGSNIKEGTQVLNAPGTDINHWVAAISRGTGYAGFMYPKAAVGADAGNAAINNSDEFITTPLFVKQFVAAALAALPTVDVKVQSISYLPALRVIRTIQTDGSTFDITIPQASSTVDGLLKIVQASQISGAGANDSGAATPALVSAMIAAAIASLPAAFDTKVNGFVYNTATRQLVISDNNGGTFNVTLPQATDALFGLTKYATNAMYPAYNGSNTYSATPAFVMAAINDALSALPGDKFLQGLQSYDALTNVMTLLMSDGSTVDVNLTALLNDAIASIPHATAAVWGVTQLVVGNAASVSNTQAATPEWVNAAIAAAVHAPAAVNNTDGYITVAAVGQVFTLTFNLAAMPSATAGARGLAVLATAAEGPAPADEVQATTPAYVESRIGTLVPAATGTVAGKVMLATATEGAQPLNDADAATPKYVADAITAAGHVPMTFTSSDGSILNAGAGQALDLTVNPAILGGGSSPAFPMPWDVAVIDNNGTGSSSIRAGYQTIGAGAGPGPYSANPGLGGFVHTAGEQEAQTADGWHAWPMTATMAELRTPPLNGGVFDYSQGFFVCVDNDTATFTTELNFVGVLVRYNDGTDKTVMIGPNNFLGGFLPFGYGPTFTQSTLASMRRPDMKVGTPSNSGGFPVNIFHIGMDIADVIPAGAALISADLVVFWGTSTDSYGGCTQGWSASGSWFARQSGSKTLAQFLASAN